MANAPPVNNSSPVIMRQIPAKRKKKRGGDLGEVEVKKKKEEKKREKSAFFSWSQLRRRRWATDHIQSGGDHVNSPPSWEGDMQSSPSPLCQDQINGNLKVGITALIRRRVPGRGPRYGPRGNVPGSKPIPLVRQLAAYRRTKVKGNFL